MKLVCFALARADLVQDLVDIRIIGCCQRRRTGDSRPTERGSGADLRRVGSEVSLASPPAAWCPDIMRVKSLSKSLGDINIVSVAASDLGSCYAG
jgi:hypothetical protein